MSYCRSWCASLLLVLVTLIGCSGDPVVVKADAIRRGDALVDQGQFARAAAAYAIAVLADGQDGPLRLKLARAYASAGRGQPAATEALQGALLMPSDIDAQILAGTLLLSQSRFDDALDRTVEVLRTQPDHVEALIIRGNAKAQLFSSTAALFRMGGASNDIYAFEAARRDLRPRATAAMDAEAEEALRKAYSLAPTRLESQLALGNFLWATGQMDEGEQILRAAADQNPGQAAVNQALGQFYMTRRRAVDAERYLKNAASTGIYGHDARLVLADFYIRTRREKDALALLGRMGASDDIGGAVTLRTANVEFRMGQREQAMRRVEALLSRDPVNRSAVLVKAQFLTAMHDWARALPLARTAVAQDPSSDAHLTLGQVLLSTGDLDGAANEFAEAFRLNPDSTVLPLELARLSLTRGRAQEALTYARDAVRKDPDDEGAGVTLVKALLAIRDYATADEELTALAARYPSSPAVLAQSGARHLARGNRDAARAAYARALELDKNSLEALSGLVTLDAKERMMLAARQRVDEAIAAHPRDPEYLLLAARIYVADHDTGRAETTLQHVLQLDANNEAAALLLADILSRQHRQDEARRTLAQLVERRPSAVDAQTAIGVLLEEGGHVAEARTQYERVLALSPRAPKASYRLAALYVADGQNLDMALSLAIDAKQQLPDDPAVSDVIGWVYARKNLPVVAAQHLEDAVAGAPENPVYRYHLGSAYLAAGRLRQARVEMTRALEIDRDFAYADPARKALASMRK